MGMFDYVRVDYNVPDMPAATLQNLSWQTKDLENQLLQYLINRDGELTLYGAKQDFTGVIALLATTGSFLSDDLQFYDLFIQFEEGSLVRISNRLIRQNEGMPAPAESEG